MPNEIRKTLSVFNSLISEDPDIIINTDSESEDCPCPDLIFELEGKLPISQDKLTDLLALGMLWLYCNVNSSIEYFYEAQKLSPSDANIPNIIPVIKDKQHTTGFQNKRI